MFKEYHNMNNSFFNNKPIFIQDLINNNSFHVLISKI